MLTAYIYADLMAVKPLVPLLYQWLDKINWILHYANGCMDNSVSIKVQENSQMWNEAHGDSKSDCAVVKPEDDDRKRDS